MSDVTTLLERLNRDDPDAFNELVPVVYGELRRRAARYLTGKQNGHTLQPTALVHECFLKLVGRKSDWKSSRHFYNAAAEVMRQILVSHARAKSAAKRSGGGQRVELEGVEPVAEENQTDWESLDRALGELRELDERRYQVVMFRYFAGLSDAQVARALDVSEKTIERDWKTARVFLRARMRE